MKAAKFPQWKEYNTDQCWMCKNRVGSTLRKMRSGLVHLPECRIENKYMTNVYDKPCSKFKKF
jgi:hypothetical protein